MRSLFRFSCLIIFTCVSPEAVFAEEPSEGHAALEAEHSLEMGRRRLNRVPSGPSPRPALRAGDPTGPRLTREVIGYLPYWSHSAADPYVPARWDLISTLAWFAVGMDGTGAVGKLNGWGGAATAAITAEAHRHGVKVVVTITNFADAEITSILGSATNRARAIATCLSLMDRHGADGVNIDFEFVPRVSKDDFVTFMTDLKTAVRERQPNGHDGHVTLAGPSVDWNGSYRYRALLENTDGIMVMAYGYHYGGGNPGPNSPLESGTLWRTRSIAWTVADYREYGGAENMHKVFIGLPWYGRAWQVADQTIPGTKLANGSSKFYVDAEPQAQANGKSFEPISRSPYYHYTSGGKLYQTWYDDERSLTDKIAWIDDEALGGIGIWALGYEGDGPDLWNSIDFTIGPLGPNWVDPEPVEPGPEAAPEIGPEVGPEPSPEADPEPADAAPDSFGDDVAEPAGEADVDRDPGSTSRPSNVAPTRQVSLITKVDPGEGCQGGGRGAGAWSLLALLGLLALGRRSSGSARS